MTSSGDIERLIEVGVFEQAYERLVNELRSGEVVPATSSALAGVVRASGNDLERA